MPLILSLTFHLIYQVFTLCNVLLKVRNITHLYNANIMKLLAYYLV